MVLEIKLRFLCLCGKHFIEPSPQVLNIILYASFSSLKIISAHIVKNYAEIHYTFS